MSQNIFSMQLDGTARGLLRTIAGCAIFLGVSSAISILYSLYSLFVIMPALGALGGGVGMMTVIVLLFQAGLCYLMLNFGMRVRKGLQVSNIREVERGVTSLRLYFAIITVLILIAIGLFLLVFLIFGAAALSR